MGRQGQGAKGNRGAPRGEEETEIFKKARNAISKEESEALAREIEAFKEEARKEEPQLARR
jgi:hypothetical protein